MTLETSMHNPEKVSDKRILMVQK